MLKPFIDVQVAEIESGLSLKEIETEALLENKKLNEMLGLKSSQVEASNNYKSCIESIKNNVSRLVTELNEKYPEIELNEIEQELKLKGISESEIFWYVRGHLLYNSVIKIIMQKLIGHYRKEARNWYETHSDSTHRENKVKEYKNKVKKF